MNHGLWVSVAVLKTEMWKTLISLVVLASFPSVQAGIGCFIRGECVQSPIVESAESGSMNECLAFCKVSDALFHPHPLYCSPPIKLLYLLNICTTNLMGTNYWLIPDHMHGDIDISCPNGVYGSFVWRFMSFYVSHKAKHNYSMEFKPKT